jgi:hypothetical protein
MSEKPLSAGEKYGILGRRFIRRAPPGKSTSDSKPIKLWDIQTKPGTTASRLQAVYLNTLSTVDAVEGRKAEAAASGKYTADGVRADTLTFAVQQAGIFKLVRQQIEAARREASEMRSKLKLEPADKTDLAGAMRRAELRDWLRSKPQAERDSRWLSLRCGLGLRSMLEGFAPEIPDWANDQHTLAGALLPRGPRHFRLRRVRLLLSRLAFAATFLRYCSTILSPDAPAIRLVPAFAAAKTFSLTMRWASRWAALPPRINFAIRSPITRLLSSPSIIQFHMM